MASPSRPTGHPGAGLCWGSGAASTHAQAGARPRGEAGPCVRACGRSPGGNQGPADAPGAARNAPLRAGPDPATAREPPPGLRTPPLPLDGALACQRHPEGGVNGHGPRTGQGPRGRPNGPPASVSAACTRPLLKPSVLETDGRVSPPSAGSSGRRPCGAQGSPLPPPPPPLLALRGPRLRPRDSGPADVSPLCTRGCNVHSEVLRAKAPRSTSF